MQAFLGCGFGCGSVAVLVTIRDLSLNHLICRHTTTRFLGVKILGVKISGLAYDNPRRGLELIGRDEQWNLPLIDPLIPSALLNT